MKVNTHFRGVSVACEVDYFPYEKKTWEEPGSEEEVNLYRVWVGSIDPVDIFDLLTEQQVIEIECQILKQLNEKQG